MDESLLDHMLHHIELKYQIKGNPIQFTRSCCRRLNVNRSINAKRASATSQVLYKSFCTDPIKILKTSHYRKESGLNHLAFHVGSRAQVDEMTKKMRQWSAHVLYEDL